MSMISDASAVTIHGLNSELKIVANHIKALEESNQKNPAELE